MKNENTSTDLTGRQKFAKKTSWITWLAFVAIGIAAIVSLTQHH
ncbi:conserved protein of unknown function (plasmid) [Paraburkholderia dioscoreae]|uniref:Uncharacterized protein n=1 Tax=Paraburkholderia dioscoreae TaxID=2604047 RepID=A0A5Q4YUW8_9BURK|nr:conserved protein of unknown function [Paraburkholderia dioscoreae]